jgi:hypothetical protein
MKTMARLTLPQELAATLFGLIYLGFFRLWCRYCAERSAKRASQDVENPWNLFPPRSYRRAVR